MILLTLQTIGFVIDTLRDTDALLQGHKAPRREDSMGMILTQAVVNSRGAK